MDEKTIMVNLVEINETCGVCGREITRVDDIGAFEPATLLDGATDEPGYCVCKDERCLEVSRKLNEEMRKTPYSKADQRKYTCERCGHRFWWPLKKRIRYCAKCGAYQQSRGLDINIECESTTLSHPDKIYKNLSKGMAQDRVVFFAVATTEDAHKLCEMLREFIEEKYKGYVIDPTKAFRESALPRKPTKHDYKIFIVDEGEELKQMDATTGKIKIVEKVATVDIPAESFDLWKSLITVLDAQLSAAGGDTSTITLQRLYEEVQRIHPNITLNGLLDAMKKADMVPQQLDVKEIRNTICIITKRATERMRATVRQMNINTEEERKTEESENALILKASQLLRKRITEAKGRETFADVGDMARKLNTNKWIIAKMLRKMAVELDPIDHTVTVLDENILNEEDLQTKTPTTQPVTETPPKPLETLQEPQTVQPTQEPTQPPAIVKERPKLTDQGTVSDQEKEVRKIDKEEKITSNKEAAKKTDNIVEKPSEKKELSKTEKIVNYFKNIGEASTIDETAKSTNVDHDYCKTALARLADEGTLKRIGRGIYIYNTATDKNK